MLRHFGHRREYWFCRNCWQEMPDLESMKQVKYHSPKQIVNLSNFSRVLVKEPLLV